ncbi:CaiB/BaiF CoA transferase family protein [Nocardia fusca]|uniref:CaiB/BaiF CoA transferase family protein n=1 Tax=Nocardia fusca TaxID=941183 RepID=UPI0007A76231|nr:CoA transferase [Nocardia fusca]
MSLPLHGVRVLDLTDGLGESCGRYLADLGAEVVRIEQPGGSYSRSAEPVVDGVSIPFALRNANKHAITADLTTEAGRERLRELAGTADILIESQPPGRLTGLGVGSAEIHSGATGLVWVSISGFGQDGPYRHWQATEPVLYAMSGVLSRSGAPGEEPLLPPAGLIEETVGVHAAWAALLAYHRRLDTGAGDTVDLSAFEAIVHGFDPGFGTQGSAAAGRSEDFPRGRPDAANFYPVFPCRDGQVRICMLAKRQWRGMFEWLGSPAEFADPKYDTIPARFAAADTLHPLIEKLFAEHTQAELVAEGSRRGVPVGGVHTLTEVLETEHFAASGALVDTEIGAGLRARVPSGYVSFDGRRAGFRTPAPELGEHDDAAPLRGGSVNSATARTGGATDDRESSGTGVGVPESMTAGSESIRRGSGEAGSCALASAGPDRESARTGAADSAPLAGLRVLDLGVIVFGAELSRQFADYGADVIKIENANFPDGLRQSRRGSALAASVAWGHRNKRSLGLDLRSADGIAVFRRLAADADVVLANFKPGTLASMGLSYDVLAELNPRLVVSESSAFGSTGPWRTRLGYGPLVRASCGVSALWRYPDDAELLCDGQTVYPDHIAAQVTAVAVLATLIGRRRTGRGTHIEVAQADTALVHLGTQLVTEALLPGTVTAPGNADPYTAPSGVYACAGDDEWCVVTVHDDHQWAALCGVLDRLDLLSDTRLSSAADRIANRPELDRIVAAWLHDRDPQGAAAELQEAGVPAGAMLRLPQLLTDPHLTARGSYTQVEHDQLPMSLPAAARAAVFTGIADPPTRQAPLAGEHTREICTELGMDSAEIDALIGSRVLQTSATGATPIASSPRESRAVQSRRA